MKNSNNDEDIHSKALFVNKIGKDCYSHEIKCFKLDPISKEEIVIKSMYSSINHKDIMVSDGNPGLVRRYPHIPGIDVAGIVYKSKNNKIKVHNGGPVNQDNLYFIHNKPNVISDSIKFFNGLYWGGNFESVIESINSEKLDDSSIKFFSGYTGWSHDQLKEEIKNDSWIIANNDEKIEFNKDSKKLWGNYMKKMSAEFKIWSNAPENPQSN